MIIKNAKVYYNMDFIDETIYIENDLITNNSNGLILDAKGCYAIPGLIDIHLHGCNGYDFCDGTVKALDEICTYQANNGITAITPASMALPEKELTKIFEAAANYKNNKGAIFCGINMEGPFLSHEKKGAQNPEYLHKPNIQMFERLQKAANGKIKISCIAPELEGTMEYIRYISKKTKISLAHTNSTYDIAVEAIKNGANHITHLFNAMPSFLHRSPGIIGAAAESNCVAEIICDGIHVHPSMIRAAIKLFGNDRIALISDSMRATGLKNGLYTLGDLDVHVKGRYATLNDGTIAGSVTNLFDCMINVIKFGIRPESAIKMATEVPAKEIYEFKNMGSIDIGKLANILILDDSWNIKKVILKGQIIN